MYTREMFGQELKHKIKRQESFFKIGQWAHTMYIEHIMDIDLDFRELLLSLNTMELGPEFERSYEELDEIANKLIMGQDVKL